MVAKVITGKSIKGALNYNEDKVQSGLAICFEANQFPADAADLTFSEKLSRFTKLIDLKPTVRTNTVHIILSFAPGEDLSTDKLKSICSRYMERLGFDQQPYLAYRHLDTHHPHVHIVTTNITAEGKAIDLHNIGRIRSEDARKTVESEFCLARAEGRQLAMGNAHDLKSIVRSALQYKFTSLAELNLVLGQFNAIADRGREGTTMYEQRGLVYGLVDAEGKRTGKVIKASRISTKATLPALERAFAENQVARLPFKAPLRQAVDKAVTECKTLDQLAKQLDTRGIKVVLRRNPQGAIYGLSFLDLNTRCVFKGSDLGRAYSAKSLQDRMRATDKSVLAGEQKVHPVPVAAPRRAKPADKPSTVTTRRLSAKPQLPGASSPTAEPRRALIPSAQGVKPHKAGEPSRPNSTDKLLSDLLAPTPGVSPNQSAALGSNKKKKRKRKRRL